MFRLSLIGLLVATFVHAQDDPISKLYSEARADLAAKRYDDARKKLESAIAEANKAKGFPPTNLALLIYEMGELYLVQSDFQAAEKYYQQALAIRKQHLPKDNPSTSNAEDRLGEVYTGLRQFDKAEPLLLGALASRTRALKSDHSLIDRSLQNLGHFYERVGRYDKAEDYFGQSVRFNEAKFGKEGLQVAFSLNLLGAAQSRGGHLAEAERTLTRCLEIAEAKTETKNLSFNIPLKNMAMVQSSLGRYGAAEKLYQRALKIAETLNGADSLEVASIFNELGQLHDRLGNRKQAIGYAEQSVTICRQRVGNDASETAHALASLGLILQGAGDFTKAEVAMLSAIATAERRLGKSDTAVATMLNNLGLLYNDASLYDKAEVPLKRALAIRENTFGKDHPLIAQVVINLGDLAARREQFDQAEALYARARKMLEASGKSSYRLGVLLNNIYRLRIDKDGQVHLGLLEDALKIFESQLGPDHPSTSLARLNVGYGYFRGGQFAKAEPLLRSARASLLKSRGESHPDTIEGGKMLAYNLYPLGRIEDAIRVTDEVRRGTRQFVIGVLPGQSDADQQTFLRERDALSLAHALTIGMLHPDKGAAASAEWLLNGKAMIQETRAASAQVANAGNTTEAAEMRDVNRELSKLTVSADASDDRVAKQRLALILRAKELTARIGAHRSVSVAWVDLESVRKQLPAKAAFIDIARFGRVNVERKSGEKIVGPVRYVAWITPKTGPVRVVDLGLADEIDDAVSAARKQLEAAQKIIAQIGEPAAETQLRASLDRVAKKVLHPILKEIGTAEDLLISPDGALWLMPWTALTMPDGKYAVEKFRIRHAVSGRDLLATSATGVKPSAPLILADPDFDLSPADALKEAKLLLRGKVPDPLDTRGLAQALGLGKVRRLPGTAAEAEAVAPRLEKWLGTKPLVHTERQALKSVVKTAKNPEALILSTHGYFRPDQETELRETAPGATVRTIGKQKSNYEDALLRCGLLFAACNAGPDQRTGAIVEDGLLTGLEVVNCDLRGTKLVVLSACETGLGDVRNGEGVAGLRQAFQLAGAESVVATLWQIPDLPSAQLMTAFFDGLASGTPRDQALSNAQREVIAKRRDRFGAAHPFYWAAYTYTGAK